MISLMNHFYSSKLLNSSEEKMLFFIFILFMKTFGDPTVTVAPRSDDVFLLYSAK